MTLKFKRKNITLLIDICIYSRASDGFNRFRVKNLITEWNQRTLYQNHSWLFIASDWSGGGLCGCVGGLVRLRVYKEKMLQNLDRTSLLPHIHHKQDQHTWV